MTFGAAPFGSRTFGDGTADSGIGTAIPTTEVALPVIVAGDVFGPEYVAEPRSIGLPFLGDTGRAFGPSFTVYESDGSPVFVAPLTVWVLDPAMGSTLAELDKSHGRQWRDQMCDAGAGQVVVQNEHASPVTTGRILRFDVDGVAAWSMVVGDQPRTRRSKAQAEEAGQSTTVPGRGLLSLFEHCVVMPALGAGVEPWGDQRIINFVDPSFDDSSWPFAVETLTNVGMIGVDPVDLELYPPTPPAGFPTRDAIGIWSVNSAGPSVPQGYNYFRRQFTVATDVRVLIAAAADDAYDVYLDGLPMLTDAGYFRGQFQTTDEFVLSAGTHTIAVRAENQNAAKAMLWLAVMEVDPATGTLDTTPILISDSSWRVLGYPATVPGFTAGGALGLLMDEWLADGQLSSSWSRTFDANVDSNGNPWAEIVDLTVEVGLDGLSVIRQLTETYMDVEVSPGALVLHAYNVGEMGRAGAVTFTRYEELAHTVDDDIRNSLLVRYDGGYTVVENATSIGTYGRRRGFLRIEGQPNVTEVQRVAGALVEVNGAPRTTSVATINPPDASEQPYVAFRNGDWSSALDENDLPEAQRVRSIACTEDVNGKLTWVCELNDLLVERDSLIRRTLKRAVNGTLGGHADSASFRPATPPPPSRQFLEVIPPFSFSAEVFEEESGFYIFSTYERIVGVIASGICTGSSVTTELAWFYNGTQFGADLQLFATGVDEPIRNTDNTLDVQFAPGDTLSVAVVAAGDHKNVVVKFIGAR